MTDLPLLMKLERAAELLDCKKLTVQRLVYAGKLQTVGERKGLRIVTASLLQYIEDHKQERTDGQARTW
jgi:excisionase family DNA binding protein